MIYICFIQVGLDKRFLSEQTRITYCTTGILLEKLIAKKDLSQFTHIILDEVHDRDSELDFLFVIIRILMNRSPNVKLILMSATIDTRKFAEYFKTSIDTPAPVVHVVQENKYKVKIQYIDEIIKYDSNVSITGHFFSEEYVRHFVKTFPQTVDEYEMG